MSAEDLDPAEFVERIRRLGEHRDQEDAERLRKLEEEIIQGRSERLARRAERARSLSPDKPSTPQSTVDSPPEKPQPKQQQDDGQSEEEHRGASSRPTSLAGTPTPKMQPPSQPSAHEESLQRLTASPADALDEFEPKKPAPNAAALRRSGTLSWQQRRPQSGVGSVRRPLSQLSSTSLADKRPDAAQEPPSPERPIPSKAQIAESLSRKDPAWFRQTPDRGITSPAYRRSQHEPDTAEAASMSTKRQLPGMSQSATPDAEVASPPSETPRSISPSRASSVRGSAAFSNRYSTNTSVSGGEADRPASLSSPLPKLESQKFAPPSEQGSIEGADQASSGRALAMSPMQGRFSPERAERPSSPTKGMGGFVQSAMLKRSDSVSKRWSAHAPQPLSRQNSTMSNRSSVAMGALPPFSKLERPSSLSRDNSIEPSSRPASSSSNLTITKGVADKEPEFAKPMLPRHSRSKSIASTFSEDNRPQDETDPPSPSKRWSPTKSTWLESALKKPDSPKPKQAAPQQPSWMAEISRKKQERGSVDLGNNSPLHNSPAEGVSSGRSSPIKDIKLRPISVGKGDALKKETTTEPPQPPVKPKPSPSIPSPDPVVEEGRAISKSEEQTLPSVDNNKTSEAGFVAMSKSEPPSAAPLAKDSPLSPTAPKKKPETPPKKDFRAGLRPRQNTVESSKKKEEVAEFQNVFGRLKKTKTENYVAPDLLKDNILRGKSALNVTGGPRPSERKDEFKESLISKKQAMLAKAQEGGSTLKKTDTPNMPSPTPEALAKRQLLGRSNSISKPIPKEAEEPPLPEALAKRRLLGRSDSISKVVPPKAPGSDMPSEAISRKQSLGADTLQLRNVETEAAPPLAYRSKISKSTPQFDAEADASKSAEKKTPPEPSPLPSQPVKSSKLADRFNPALAGILARGPPSATPASKASNDSPNQTTSGPPQPESTGAAPQLTHMTKGRARGPKRRAPGAKQEKVAKSKVDVATAATGNVAPDSSEANVNLEDSKPTGTPNRASLKAKPVTPIKSPRLSLKPEKTPPPEIPRKSLSLELERKTSSEIEKPRRTDQSANTEAKEVDARTPEIADMESMTKARHPHVSSVSKPETPPPNVAQRRVSKPLPTPPPKSITEKSTSPVPPPKTSPKSGTAKAGSALQEIPPPNGDKSSPVKEAHPGKISVKSVTSLWDRQSPASSPGPVRAKSPVKLPTRADEQHAMEAAGLVRPEQGAEPARGSAPSSKSFSEQPKSFMTRPGSTPAMTQPQRSEPAQANSYATKPKPVGLGLGSLGGLGGLVAAHAARSRDSSPPKVEIGSGKTFSAAPSASTNRPKSVPLEAPPKANSTEELLVNFFNEPPVTTAELPKHIDTLKVLKNPPVDMGPGGKIRTRQKQIQEISGDGNLKPVPAQEEHVLFQDSMHLCVHEFEDAKGTRVIEVYLWCGNGVPESTVEDTQLFARDIAKRNQAKLIVLRQGKETPNFFEALGGIVITRRGSRPGSRKYMLCGRRHLGHITFDEVDFSLDALCSGFTYIIHCDNGKGFIWKGRGSSAEELSSARLTGNGELVEVDEGSEPTDLLDAFPTQTSSIKGSPIPRSADHWRYKPNCDKYRSRLFRLEQQEGSSGWGQSLQSPSTPKSPPNPTTNVIEIMPYCQRDLEPEHIYVLDAFFDIYVIIGALSRSQSAAFSTALLFAQEYRILAASEEDRPFVPYTTIVLEGVPRDMKAAFRSWDEGVIPAAGLINGRLGRGKSLRILSLDKAIAITKH